jgi:hypothetical protein
MNASSRDETVIKMLTTNSRIMSSSLTITVPR